MHYVSKLNLIVKFAINTFALKGIEEAAKFFSRNSENYRGQGKYVNG